MARIDLAADGLVRTVVGRHGFAAAGILTDWPEIVGARIAAGSQPLRLQFPRGARSHGVLHVRVATALALEIQHSEPQLIERINRYFGYAAVQRIRLSQGPVGPRDPGGPPPRPDLSAAARQAIDTSVAAVPEAGLRDALAELGALIAAADAARDGESS